MNAVKKTQHNDILINKYCCLVVVFDQQTY